MKLEQTRKTIVVSHPAHGEVTVKAARHKLDALHEAARQWKVCWTALAADPEVSFREVAE